ncbi:COMM domain-containing protein 4-like [Anneissia japonica]|uniref:COMM domain-containing protein 4-like n=1 Tax=Anneissia japonica TaxID=1529436 RepID=UPI00142595B0|nr:COMM domain-containing protein 4-like [Anneissia japonica]
MRFRFCGDLDCPDWVLAEISTLSKITSVKMKLLCTQVIKDMLGESIDYEKVYKLTSDAKYETSDVKAAIAALNFIFNSATKYDVDGDSLSNELQQLGLPKEHASSLCRSYQDKKSVLEKKFREQSLRLSRLESVEWRVDYILSSSELQEVNDPCVQLKLNIANSEKTETDSKTFTMDANKFRIFLSEMKQTLKMMESL